MLGKLEEYMGFENMRTRVRIEWCVCVCSYILIMTINYVLKI